MDRLFELIKRDLFEFFPREYRGGDQGMRDLADDLNNLRDELFKYKQGKGNNLTIEDFRYYYDPVRSSIKIVDRLAQTYKVIYSNSLPEREKRRRVFGGVKEAKLHGTVEYLINRIEEVTGVRPDILFRGDFDIGWDQKDEINDIPPNTSPVDFYGGIMWDQNNEFFEVFQPSPFIWRVFRTSLLIDIKNQGVFDADPIKNAEILERTYLTVAKYKEATKMASVGYIDNTIGTDVILKEVYNTRLIITPGDVIPPEFEPKTDPGLY